MTATFDKNRVLDRRKELDAFREFVLGVQGGRLMTFHADKYAGKSLLMERLAYAARKELRGNDAPPTVLLIVDRDEPLSDMMDRLAGGLKVRGVAVPRYDAVVTEYMAASTHPVTIDASTTVEGRARNVTGATITLNATATRPGVELILRRKAPSALIEDLEVAARGDTVVLMIDQLEKASVDHCAWIEELLRRAVFAEDGDHGLAVVMAGTIDDGYLVPEDIEKIAGAHKGTPRCHVRRGLSLFERQDIVELLALMSASATNEQIDMLEKWVRTMNTGAGRLANIIAEQFGVRPP